MEITCTTGDHNLVTVTSFSAQWGNRSQQKLSFSHCLSTAGIQIEEGIHLSNLEVRIYLTCLRALVIRSTYCMGSRDVWWFQFVTKVYIYWFKCLVNKMWTNLLLVFAAITGQWIFVDEKLCVPMVLRSSRKQVLYC